MSIATWMQAISSISLGYAASIAGSKVSNGPQQRLNKSITLRKNQVYDKNIEIKNQDWSPTEISIQRHAAKRRGLHYDVRMSYKKRMLSFVNNDGLNKNTRENIIRTNDHVMKYADFEGTIPDGEIGAGKVKLVYRNRGLLHTEKTDRIKLKLIIPDGKYEGLYNFIQMEDNKYKVHKSNIPPNIIIPRHKYKLLTLLEAKQKTDLLNTNYIAEEKMNGAYASMKIGKYGSSITGRNESVKGKVISYNYKAPHLIINKSNKYAGTILTGEIYSRKGTGALTSILNSNVIDSNRLQQKHGKLDYYPFDINILYINGKKISITNYAEKRIILKDINENLSSPFIHTPTSAVENKFDFYGNVIKKYNGEGIVIKSLDNNNLPWYKVVKTVTKDMKIIAVTEGTGKFKGNGIGSFIVEDADASHKVHIGTGLNDIVRKDAYMHPKKYIGKIIKVTAKEITSKSMIGPRFIELHPDKKQADNL